MKTFKTLLKTELMLSIRGMDMPIFAIGMPLAALILLGLLSGDRPAFEGAGYTFFAQSFGAVSTIALCAGGVMGLPLVISDYRRRGILKRLKVTPIHPAMILTAQVTQYALYALTSLLLVAAAATAFFGFRMQGSWIVFIGGYLLVMISLFSIGLMVGGIAPNEKIAGVIASLLYFPMLLLSGATLPYEIMPTLLQKAADLLPLTQGIKLLKAAALDLPMTGVAWPILTMATLAVVCSGIAIRYFRWE